MPLPGSIRALLPFVMLAAGCSDRPKAPPLVNESVYQNERVGVRFLAPEGWSITSRSEVPPGPLARPVLLVSYVQSKAEKAAEFELLTAELPEFDDLGRYL